MQDSRLEKYFVRGKGRSLPLVFWAASRSEALALFKGFVTEMRLDGELEWLDEKEFNEKVELDDDYSL